MYTDDAYGMLVPNPEGGDLTGWVAGDMTNPAQRTDRTLLQRSALGNYTKNPRVYQCPGDRSENIRSIAMNPRMGNPQDFADGFAQFQKLESIPKPDQYFVFVEERGDVIDDGYFREDLTYAYGDIHFWDWPANNHERRGTLSFADGHVESHKWRENSTCPGTAERGAHVPVNKDAIYLFMHTSYATDGSDWPCDTCVIYFP